jgi:hypothetical protein
VADGVNDSEDELENIQLAGVEKHEKNKDVSFPPSLPLFSLFHLSLFPLPPPPLSFLYIIHPTLHLLKI